MKIKLFSPSASFPILKGYEAVECQSVCHPEFSLRRCPGIFHGLRPFHLADQGSVRVGVGEHGSLGPPPGRDRPPRTPLLAPCESRVARAMGDRDLAPLPRTA